MYDETFMKRAIEISRAALSSPGTQPFGAVVVKDGAIVGEGLNRSAALLDPTSHGEVEAIRDACRTLGSLDLTGCELYTSCEPCPLCVAAMAIAGIARLYYAASLDQAGAAFTGLSKAHRHSIDLDLLRAEAGAPVNARRLPAEQRLDGEAVAVLREWAVKRTAS